MNYKQYSKLSKKKKEEYDFRFKQNDDVIMAVAIYSVSLIAMMFALAFNDIPLAMFGIIGMIMSGGLFVTKFVAEIRWTKRNEVD